MNRLRVGTALLAISAGSWICYDQDGRSERACNQIAVEPFHGKEKLAFRER